jgi:heme-degrading monooxygenase HmoA
VKLEKKMIARVWRGQTTRANAEAYRSFVTTKIFRSLEKIPGHRGAYLLKRDHDGLTEFLVITHWDSIEAVRDFAGDNVDAAVVEPEARTILSDFDTFVRHYDVAHDSVGEKNNR